MGFEVSSYYYQGIVDVMVEDVGWKERCMVSPFFMIQEAVLSWIR